MQPLGWLGGGRVVEIYITASATFALEVEDAASEVLGSLYTGRRRAARGG